MTTKIEVVKEGYVSTEKTKPIRIEEPKPEKGREPEKVEVPA
jgi:hypothetical protein